MVDRRGLLAGAAALALSGCGRTATDDEPGGAPPRRTTTSKQGDIELLKAAYAMEMSEADAHTGRFSVIDREHAGRIAAALRDLGAEPPRETTEPAPRDGQESEGRAIAFYLDMLPKVYDAKLRSLIASILVVEAEQLAVLRARDDQDPAPDAFVYGTPA